MNIYLIRHGIATERGTYADDEIRPLTKKGHIKTNKVARQLLSIGIKFDSLLSSPLVRAYQTATILQQIGLCSSVVPHEPLKPNGDIHEFLEYFQGRGRDSSNYNLALVGHQPDLSSWAEMLVWGSTQNRLTLKKAGIIGLEVRNNNAPIGGCQLFLLISPKWFI